MLYTEETTMLKDALRRYIANLDTDTLAFGDPCCPELMRQAITDLGIANVAVPEAHDGAGLGMAGVTAVAEELGRSRLPSPWVSRAVLAPDVLQAAGAPESLLAAVVAGELSPAVTFTDSVTFSKEADQYFIEGALRFVPDLAGADTLLVVVNDATANTKSKVFNVALSNLQLLTLDMVDGSDFHHVDIPPSTSASFVGTLDNGVAPLLDRARLALAAEMAGLTAAALELTTEYLRTREQFGVKIGSFQALQHRLAKVYIKLEMAQASIQAAVLAEGNPDFARAATVANFMANSALHVMSNECVQMHGGIGMTDEHIAGHYLKRARILENCLGGKKAVCDRYGMLRDY